MPGDRAARDAARRRAAAPAWASGLAVGAAMAGGALAILLTCPIVDPDHVLLGHAAPVAVFGALAAWGRWDGVRS